MRILKGIGLYLCVAFLGTDYGLMLIAGALALTSLYMLTWLVANDEPGFDWPDEKEFSGLDEMDRRYEESVK